MSTAAFVDSLPDCTVPERVALGSLNEGPNRLPGGFVLGIERADFHIALLNPWVDS